MYAAEGSVQRCVVPISPCKARNLKKSFSVTRMGSHGIFVLCTSTSICMRIDAAKRRFVQAT